MVKTGYGSRVHVGSELGPGGAVMFIEAGKKTALGFYTDNNVVLYIDEGSVYIKSIIDGTVKNMEFFEGQAVTVERGMLFQVIGRTNAKVIEFGSNNLSYTAQPGAGAALRVIEKETPLPVETEEDVRPEDLPSVVMTDVDKANVDKSKDDEEKTPKTKAAVKKTKKKTARRKKATKKN